MGMNFPNSPAPGQLYTPVGGYQYVYLDGVWRVVEDAQNIGTALSRNRIVNGAMQISQENGDNASAATGYYPADQWQGHHVGLTSPAIGRNSGASNPSQIVLSGLKATLAAGDVAFFQQNIEGVIVRDFKWGTAAGLPAVLRFETYVAIAGTYSVSLRNAAADRSFLAAFVVPLASTWTTIIIPIPPDTTGTWLTTTGVGINLSIVFATGSTYLGASGWQAGNKLGITGMSNGYATLGGNYIRNVGLYLDPNNTGVPPPWQEPNEAEEHRACERYYLRIGGVLSFGYTAAGGSVFVDHMYRTKLRNAPAVTFGTTTYYNASALIVNSNNIDHLRVQVTITALGGGYAAHDIIANARM